TATNSTLDAPRSASVPSTPCSLSLTRLGRRSPARREATGRPPLAKRIRTPSRIARIEHTPHGGDRRPALPVEPCGTGLYVFWYSGPSPPSGGVSRPPLAVIAPHWMQLV